MILLDVIVGYYMPTVYGWIFLLLVLFIETLILSKFLKGAWNDLTIWKSVIISNTITTIIGYFIFDERHRAGYLLNWPPIYEYHGSVDLYTVKAIFIVSFIVSTVVETGFNLFILRKSYSLSLIVGGTVLINFTTYAIAGLTFWLYYETHDIYDPSSWGTWLYKIPSYCATLML